ncbi:MAG TPA: hypothetical protein VF644_01710 [Pyrinomonadaceae bacterium]|jgi:hypothetical protein
MIQVLYCGRVAGRAAGDLAEKIIQNKKAALGDAAELSTRIIKRLSKRAQSKTRTGTLDFAASHNYPAFLPML